MYESVVDTTELRKDEPKAVVPRQQGNVVVIESNSNGARLEFSWQPHDNPQHVDEWRSVDIVFQLVSEDSGFDWNRGADEYNVLPPANSGDVPEVISSLSAQTFKFFMESLKATQRSGVDSSRGVKLVIPSVSGQIIRADVIPMRLIDCPYVESTYSLADPLETYTTGPLVLDNLHGLFSGAAAGLILDETWKEIADADARALSFFVEAELENRLSFPWIATQPTQRRTLAIVEGSRVHPSDGGTGPNIYLAAEALGIDMIVLDNEGHWLQTDNNYAHWRKAFLPTLLVQPPDADFSNRIVSSIRASGIQVDGIITYTDSYQMAVARAAEELGLSTVGPKPYEIATDKHQTSVFEGRNCFRFSSATEALDIALKHKDIYPAIIKPCNGWSSEGVLRVDNQWDLVEALQTLRKLNISRHGTEFVLEKYCAGPEVDINFVLQDGEILFCEVADDFPKGADSNGSEKTETKTFIELDTTFPSALPSQEIELLKTGFHNTLLRLGIRDGVMHLEGRVDNSSVEYRYENGVLDLRPRQGVDQHAAAPWLIEINPRPPGMKGTQIIESTHGIDYWGLTLLTAVCDKHRVRALSRPFKNGPQYTCVMVFIPVDYDASKCEGIFDSDDVYSELLERRPDLAKNISRGGTLVKRGTFMAHPSTGANSFLAYFNVFSRRSRKEALELAKKVREEVRFSFR